MSLNIDQLRRDEKIGLLLNKLCGETGEFYQDHRRYTGGIFGGTAGEERWHKLVIESATPNLETQESEGAIYSVSMQADWTCRVKGYKGLANEYNSRHEGAKVNIKLTAIVSRDIVLFRDRTMSRNDWGEISICFSRILQKHKIPML